MSKTPFEIWTDIPASDTTDRAHTEKWYSEEEMKVYKEEVKEFVEMIQEGIEEDDCSLSYDWDCIYEGLGLK